MAYDRCYYLVLEKSYRSQVVCLVPVNTGHTTYNKSSNKQAR
ncbi:hypothetical protein AsAng_0020020 [Aureispira anguillae]|uniref:Uncharacterized protein n=1 Tax=Aureispira anguillae TaxID=2864201 RepID=A0A916DSP9_9BACT|nr:hypothetical protein AsAng_0020020 [Aureispira anguillae]